MHNFIPSERFATGLMRVIRQVLDSLGLHPGESALTIVYLVAVVGLAVFSGWVIQRLIVLIVKRILDKRFPAVSHSLNQSHLLHRSGQLLPPLVLLSLIPFAFNSNHPYTRYIVLASVVYAIIAFTLAINALLTFTWIRYNTRINNKNLPLKGVTDMAKVAMWVIAVIVIISLFAHKSPWALLTGLGAFAAVLLLIFKDSILGLVAGVQLAVSDELRVGDWISVPGTEINGIVQDVSLVAVKVKNWNNTVSMLPPYSLVSGHFVNWRYMKQGGSRQIEMSALIDINTVRPLSDDELHQIQAQVPLLKDFIDVKMRQRAAGQTANVFNAEAGVDGSIDTNLGLLRAYMNLYLPRHPYVYTDRIIMVRILQPTPTGFPMQIFCYLTTADWKAYEAIMADIFEHLAAIAPTFGLSLYEQPSGRSVYSLAEKAPADAPYTGTAPINTPTPDLATQAQVGLTQRPG